MRYLEELPLIYLHDLTMRWSLRSRDKLNTFYLHLQETYRQQIIQGAVFLWEAPTLIATWSFNYVTSVTSRDKLENLCFPFHKTYLY